MSASPPPPLVLASASPRRAAILETLGVPHLVDPARLDEAPLPGERPAERVARLALEKAAALRPAHPDAWILGGDTEVVLDGRSLGKPADAADAVRMLTALSGRSHVVLSSLALDRPGETPLVEVERTRVTFRGLELREIERYVAGGEPMGKAGSYAIQGEGARLIAGIRGDYSGVVGLPIPALVRLGRRVGAPWIFGTDGGPQGG